MRSVPLLFGALLLTPIATAIWVLPSCEATADAGDSFATATPIATPAACSGTVALWADVDDYYRFHVEAGQEIAIVIYDGFGDVLVTLLNPSGAESATTRNSASFAVKADAREGDWRVRVESWETCAPCTTEYTLLITVN